MLKFSDGVNIDTPGELRTLELADGVYVVGEGMLIPMKDMEEAREYIKTEKRVKAIKKSPEPQKEFLKQVNNILKGK